MISLAWYGGFPMIFPAVPIKTKGGLGQSKNKAKNGDMQIKKYQHKKLRK